MAAWPLGSTHGSVPTKVASRIVAGIRKFQPILNAARSRDVNESDTVVIVNDILHELLGYDKYSEITSEHAIRGTFCDLAVRVDGHLAFLIEVKAVGADLKESFVKQAVDYAANQGVDWVVLTNGNTWRAYKIGFAKPISNELVLEFSFLDLNGRNDGDVEKLALISKEGWQKSRLVEYSNQREALSRFSIAAILLTSPILDVVRRELRRLSPGVKVDVDDVKRVLEEELIKRDALEGDRAMLARRLVNRAAAKAGRPPKTPESTGPNSEATTTPSAPAS